MKFVTVYFTDGTLEVIRAVEDVGTRDGMTTIDIVGNKTHYLVPSNNVKMIYCEDTGEEKTDEQD